jgi:hypothetical protein
MSHEICPHDGCPIEICGGPHVTVLTDLGEEVIKEGESPIGTPVSEMSPADQEATRKAIAQSHGKELTIDGV